MRKRKVTTLFAVSFLLVFGKQSADAADGTNYSSDSSNTQGDMFHYGFNHIYPNNLDLVYLRRMVNRMKKDPSLKLKITSHGCAIGTDDVNMKVSRLRANILEDYMMRHDISSDRIIKEWKGESEPMADNETENGRSINRRSLVQLVRTNGNIASGVNKPPGQIYQATRRQHITSSPSDLYVNNSYIPSSGSSPSKYSTTKVQPSTHNSYGETYVSSAPSSKVYRSEPIQPSSYPATNNNHNQQNSKVRNDDEVYSNHSQEPTEQPLVKPNPNAVYNNNQQDITYSPPRTQQQNTVVPTVPTPSPNTQLPNNQEEAANKDYVEIDVQQVYEDMNDELGAKGDDTNAPNANDNSANVEKYNQIADTFSPEDSNNDLPVFKPNNDEANIKKYNQLADALEDDSDEALSFTDEADLIDKSDGSMVNDNNVMDTKNDVEEDYKGKKVNQKPRPILVSEKMDERNELSSPNNEEFIEDNSAEIKADFNNTSNNSNIADTQKEESFIEDNNSEIKPDLNNTSDNISNNSNIVDTQKEENFIKKNSTEIKTDLNNTSDNISNNSNIVDTQEEESFIEDNSTEIKPDFNNAANNISNNSNIADTQKEESFIEDNSTEIKPDFNNAANNISNNSNIVDTQEEESFIEDNSAEIKTDLNNASDNISNNSNIAETQKEESFIEDNNAEITPDFNNTSDNIANNNNIAETQKEESFIEDNNAEITLDFNNTSDNIANNNNIAETQKEESFIEDNNAEIKPDFNNTADNIANNSNIVDTQKEESFIEDNNAEIKTDFNNASDNISNNSNIVDTQKEESFIEDNNAEIKTDFNNTADNISNNSNIVETQKEESFIEDNNTEIKPDFNNTADNISNNSNIVETQKEESFIEDNNTEIKPDFNNASDNIPNNSNIAETQKEEGFIEDNNAEIKPDFNNTSIVAEAQKNETVVSNNSSINTNAKEEVKPENSAPVQMPTSTKTNVSTVGKVTKTIQFIDADTGLPIQGNMDIKTKRGQVTLASNNSGEVQMPATAEMKGYADIFAKGYFYQSENIQKDNNTQVIRLKRIAGGSTMALKDLFFESGTAKILPTSFPELERLRQSMITNPDIKIEVGGHINVPFTRPADITERQQAISSDRAKAVYEYLISKGIDKSRLEYKGYGNSEMVFPQATTDEEKKQNRRVEIKIVR